MDDKRILAFLTRASAIFARRDLSRISGYDRIACFDNETICFSLGFEVRSAEAASHIAPKNSSFRLRSSPSKFILEANKDSLFIFGPPDRINTSFKMCLCELFFACGKSICLLDLIGQAGKK